jgi:hypothetical protein
LMTTFDGTKPSQEQRDLTGQVASFLRCRIGVRSVY